MLPMYLCISLTGMLHDRNTEQHRDVLQYRRKQYIDFGENMFVQMLLMLSQIALAEPTEDTTEKVEAEINEAEIQAFYEAKKEEDTAITVDMLEEDDFEMDLSALSAPVATPVTTETADGELGVELDDEMSVNTVSNAPLTPVEDLNWDLDLNEDLEIGDGNLKIAPEPKSEPVNLDFLDEEEEEEEEK